MTTDQTPPDNPQARDDRMLAFLEGFDAGAAALQEAHDQVERLRGAVETSLAILDGVSSVLWERSSADDLTGRALAVDVDRVRILHLQPAASPPPSSVHAPAPVCQRCSEEESAPVHAYPLNIRGLPSTHRFEAPAPSLPTLGQAARNLSLAWGMVGRFDESLEPEVRAVLEAIGSLDRPTLEQEGGA